MATIEQRVSALESKVDNLISAATNFNLRLVTLETKANNLSNLLDIVRNKADNLQNLIDQLSEWRKFYIMDMERLTKIIKNRITLTRNR